MQVTIRLPDQMLYQGLATKLYGEAENGTFGILPNHADFVTSLIPSVFVVTDLAQKEHYFGLERGLLIKQDKEVEVIARRGVQGKNLLELADLMQQAFNQDNEQERQARSALAKLEIGMAKQFRELKRPI